MPQLPVRPSGLSLERRRGEVQRSLEVQDDIAKLSYFLSFTGAGEASVEVNFPCRFVDLPHCSDGFSVDPTTVLTAKNFPWATCGARFKTEERAGRTFYIGATLIVVMGGTRRQKLMIHWAAEGKAIVGPIS